jgi:hypothetical protein
MGRKKLGRTEILHAYIEPSVKEALQDQKESASKFVNEAIKEKIANDKPKNRAKGFVLGKTFKEIESVISDMKDKYGAMSVSKILQELDGEQ